MPTPRWSLWAEIAGDEKAARIYDVLLTRGMLSPKEIADELACPRSTLYPAFDWLRERGLISMVTKGRSVECVATAPSRWQVVAETKRIEADQLLANVQNRMDEWTAAHKSGPRPRVRAFQGEDGLRAIREEVVRLGGEVWEYFAVDARVKAQAKIGECERIRQTSAVPKGRVLLGVACLEDIPPFFDRRLFEARSILLKEAPFSGSLTITGSRAYLISPEEGHFGLVIESGEVVQLLRSMYQRIWDQASPWNPPDGWGI